MERLVMCGGAAASTVTPQILSDAVNLPVACVAESAVSALGAAVIARGLVETSAGLARLAEEMAPAVRPYQPGRDVQLYRQMFKDYAAALPTAREAD